ncbi:MAG: hypothetical protein QG555_1638, partial [Thermodesulfobacteriota bacterium]|nr:hypothetical protein [Thermodesulfobacteriota bacterium]
MEVALIEDAQDDIDYNDRDEEKKPQFGERGFKGLGRPLKATVDAGREHLIRQPSDLFRRRDDGVAGEEIQGNGRRGMLALMVYRQGAEDFFCRGYGVQGNK